MHKTITCITCPRGCTLEVDVENGAIAATSGNQCPRGVDYAAAEILYPTRIITTTVYVASCGSLLPVRSDKPLPRDKIKESIPVIKRLPITPPVKMGDVLLRDIVNGVHIIASADLMP